MSKLQELLNRVFSNELLREHILNFAILDGNDTSIPNIRTCRLVHSSWLISVQKCLRKSRQPLFFIDLPPCNRNPTKQLQHFYTMTESSVVPGQNFPPTSLRVWRSHFIKEGFQAVANCISRLGIGLVNLEIMLPLKSCPEPVTNTTLRLPILNHVEIQIDSHTRGIREPPTFGGNSNVTSFLQLVLSGCQDLTHFTLDGDISATQSLPMGFKNLCLPPTLTTVKFNIGLSKEDCLGILQSDLPNLRTLVLPHFHKQPFHLQRIFNLEPRLGQHLKHLTIPGDMSYWSTNRLTIQLPQLKALECLRIYGAVTPQIEDGSVNDLQTIFPTLKTVEFRNRLKYRLIRSWTEGSRFESVENLHILIQEPVLGTLGVDAVELLFKAFPNITTLDLHYDMSCTSAGLNFVFENFTGVQDLRLTMSNYCCDGLAAALLGIWEGEVQRLRKRLEEDQTSDLLSGEDISLRMPNLTEMTGLRKLSLNTSGHLDKTLLIDCVFEYGLFYMPHLQEVLIRGQLEVSDSTVTKWRGMGRELDIM